MEAMFGDEGGDNATFTGLEAASVGISSTKLAEAPIETYFIFLSFTIIFLLGVGGNGCMMYIFCRYKTAMRSLPNTLMLNLALGHLLVLISTVPATAVEYILDSWPFGSFVCKASKVTKDVSIGVSVFTLTALSIDRYIAIVRPVEASAVRPKSSRRLIVISLVVTWTLSLLLATPAAIHAHVEIFEMFIWSLQKTNNDTADGELLIYPDYNHTSIVVAVCYSFPSIFDVDYRKRIALLHSVVYFALPLLVIVTFYIMMAIHLRRSVKAIPEQAAATLSLPESDSHRDVQQQNSLPEIISTQENDEDRRKVSVMVLTFAVLFTICLLPKYFFMLWFHLNPKSMGEFSGFWNVFKIVSNVLSYVNSCVNPIALCFVNPSFRKHFRQILCCTAGRAVVLSQHRTDAGSQTASVTQI